MKKNKNPDVSHDECLIIYNIAYSLIKFGKYIGLNMW